MNLTDKILYALFDYTVNSLSLINVYTYTTLCIFI